MNTSIKTEIIANLVRIAQLSLQIKCDTRNLQDSDDRHARFAAFNQYNRKFLKDIMGECDNLCQSLDNTPYVPKFIKSFTLDNLRFMRQLVNPDRYWYSNEIEFVGCQTDGQATDEMLELMQESMELLFSDVKLTLIESGNQRSINRITSYEDAQ